MSDPRLFGDDDPASGPVWRWRTVRNPWPGPPRVPHPFAGRVGQSVRVLCRGANGNLLLEFPDGVRVVAPRWSIR